MRLRSPLPLRALLRFLLRAVTGLGTPLAAAPVINEIMYRPGTGYPENTALEFVEIHNPDAAAVNVSGWAITKGVDFVFPSGTTIPARGFLVVAANPAALRGAAGIPATAIVVGPWQAGASLANRGETVTLAKPGPTAGTWETVDAVDYANEGDWAVRTRDALGGWSWASAADSAGSSLELRTPALAKNSGQAWGASTAAGGTPGAANSLLTSNVAPLILDARHSPAVPTSSDAVTVSAQLADESAVSSLSATLYWRNATSTTPGAFAAVAMAGDGTGRFAAELPALADKTIVEFYVSATDGTLTRTWPAPSSEGQNTNAAYQVDNEVVAGSAPVYRLVLTAAENAAFATYTGTATAQPGTGVPGRPGAGGGPGNQIGDRQFNVTLVASRGTDTTVRYLTSMRVRGNSSRNYTIKPLRISLPTDNRWAGVSDFMINPRGAPIALLAHRIMRAAGLVAADATPIEVRRQGIEYSVNTGSTADYGQLVRVEQLDGDYLDHHFPLAQAAQLYRKLTVTNWSYNANAPANPDTQWSGWSKENNGAANDWSDVMSFVKVWQDTAAPYFTGATAGNVAAGTWNGTPFSDADLATLSNVTDLDYFARWLAVMTVIPNAEENLSTGEDDDYAAAFVHDGTRTRFIPLPHDLDTTFGLGEVATTATNKGLYDLTEIGNRTGNFADTQMKIFLPLLGDSTRPGHAAFRARYLTAIRELFGSVFDADTTADANPAFHQFVDNHIGWTPEAYRTQIKTFMAQRQSYLLGLIGQPKIAPPAAASTSTLAATATPALRISEVLAVNTRLANGTTFPDIIELHNAGTAAVDLGGKSLTDDAATPRKYVFPAGTGIPAGGYLVVYADTDTSAPGLHTGFSLDAEGDTVRLHDTPANGGTLLDSVVFGFQIPDRSISRTGADAATWALTTPTPGAANASALALGPVNSVRINEWAGNVSFRVDHDFIELFNSAAQPVALGGVRLTDDTLNYPSRFVFPALSYVAAGGFLPLYGADFGFGLDGDFDFIFLLGANGAAIDQVDLISQPADMSTGRATDGGPSFVTFAVPTPGIANATTLPAAYAALLAQLRLTEIMYEPAAPSSPGDYEFLEVLNTGTAALDLSGVRFTNGLDYTFPAGTTLAGGSYLVVAKSRSAFSTRYPNAVARLAPGTFTGALDNNGENLALTLPAPWNVHILKFRYEATWETATAGGGYSLVTRAAATTAAKDWGDRTAWRASVGVNGSPGFVDTTGIAVTLANSTTVGVADGRSVTLSVAATANDALTFQWQRLVDGQWTPISGATASSYSVPSTATGSYRVLVTAGAGTVASGTTTVLAASAITARLTNLSTRAPSLSGANALVPGFVISGTGTKRLLLRNVGPTLGPLGVTGALADPQLTLKRYNAATGAYTDVAANDNWGTTTPLAALVNTTASLGAFALASGSADAALLVDLPPGQYSATAGGAKDGTGIALLELYDADSAATATARLTNIATRGYVGTGTDIVIAGFVIDGTGTRTVLIRAVGPALTSFGLTGVLADPRLALYRGTELLLSNDDWSTGANTAANASVATQVGAFALPAGSKDSALVATLPAGAYTVQISGTNNTTGVILVEVYEAP